MAEQTRTRRRVDPDKAAAAVAEIAQHFAYRRRHGIRHTGHTVHRLLAAVSVLLERPVGFSDGLGVKTEEPADRD